MEAAFYNQVDSLELLLSTHGILVNVQDHQGNTALMLAALKGHTRIVKLLLNLPKVHVKHRNQQGRDALWLALDGGYLDIVQLIERALEI